MVQVMTRLPSADPAPRGSAALVVRGAVLLDGAQTDVAISGGTVCAVGTGIAAPAGADVIDGRGGLLLPGLHDHHLHLMALAARRASVDLTGLVDVAPVRQRLSATPAGIVRAVGYDERAAGIPDAALLDRWLPDRPLRLQDRTGALWVLNSAALALLRGPLPAGAERDASGAPTGRFWREDRWLGTAFPRLELDLASLGRELAATGLVALTDAGAHNGPEEAAMLAGAGLPQRLTVMGNEALCPGEGYALGPLKLLLDDRDLPDPDALAARICVARGQGRPVAAHCVTEGELVVFLAALELAGGGRPEDRIEHGGLIPPHLIGAIADHGLTVVTNPGFLHGRGDRYRAEMPDRTDLYRIASLQRAGIEVRAGSDAPYASCDPWLGMRAARDRLTAAGQPLSPDERIAATDALALYCGGPIVPGGVADLVLCHGGREDALRDLDVSRVRLTVIGGEVVHARE